MITPLQFWWYKYANKQHSGTGYNAEAESPWDPDTQYANSSVSIIAVLSCNCAQQSLSLGCFSRAFLGCLLIPGITWKPY